MMYTLNDYCRKTFGEKLYKISLDGGFTCPNRDGTLGSRGCIFCSAGGSGDFAEMPHASVWEQIEAGKAQVEKKQKKGGRYIAYFQAYTNTYGPLERLEALFSEAIAHPEVSVLSIATRPDCLPVEVLQLLDRLNRIKPVWVELGLQTIHESTAAYIRRGYSLPVYERALRELKALGITVITHVILGLPGEATEDMLETVRYLAHGISQELTVKSAGHTTKTTNPEKEAASPETVNRIRTDGIKLQLLHILEGTDLGTAYLEQQSQAASADLALTEVPHSEKFCKRNKELRPEAHIRCQKVLYPEAYIGRKKEQISPLTMEEYLPLLAECIRLLPEDMVIHRITGDGPKRLLIAPLWTADKKKVMNTITRYFRENNVVQGSHHT